MKLLDRYLDKWISRKALAVLKHGFAVCGFQTIVEEKEDYYDISLKKYHRKDEKPKHFLTLQAYDGLEFYIKWYNLKSNEFMYAGEELFKNE